ncbi:MAG TPA: SGNH/GDSL hydrolase family protein, partial [Vicinamibacteria bacterium]|nr:SGNH/GDSL hydrolase family protein [Vicinamibacteria bacterium]
MAYVLGVLAFLEISSRAALSVDSFFTQVLGNDESSFRLAWIHRGEIPGIAYSFDQYHPTRGWALSPSLRDRGVFGDRVLNTNSKGIRGSREYPYAKPPGKTRVLVFGDSFTFGEEVSDEETYAAALGRALPDTDVLNMGVHGYGHDQMLLYFEEEGRKYASDVVLIGFLPYDMERNILAFRDFAKPRFVKA